MTFALLFSEALAAPELPNTGDVLSVGLPLLRQLDDLHRDQMVSRLRGLDHLIYDGVSLTLDPEMIQTAQRSAHIDRLNPISRGGIDVTARLNHDVGSAVVGNYTSQDVLDGDDVPERPVFAVGFRAWEQLVGHHDELTDIHLAGLLLVSYTTGLDLTLPPAVDDLALHHRHLLRLNPSLHPVVANVLSEMVTPDRHARPRSMADVVARLENHRDLPADLDLTEAYEASADWRQAVLSNLRERVFDTSRRNRALYFKPSSAALSLTEASVPLLLNVERIAPGDLLTWTGQNADIFRRGQPVDLEKWCRFEENPHLAPGLEKLISTERKLRAEHGQGRLRLIIAFLRWVDPENGEEINSPLLTMPAELSKKKGVRNRYLVQVGGEGEVNPVLRHVLSGRFGVELPERVETDNESLAALIADLERQVQSTAPGVEIETIDKPRISLIRRRAQLRVDAYLRRRAQAQASSGRWRRVDHSYDRDDWRPLGRALYRRFVEPTELPLRMLAGAERRVRAAPSGAMVASAAGPAARERDAFALERGDVSAQRWEVDLCAVTLASLGSRRSTLARDYDELLARASDAVDSGRDGSSNGLHPFDLMFSPDHRRSGLADVESMSIDQPLVLPADSTQAAAVRRGHQGDSFIIQGPPGTGKSQTITNLIGRLVAEGKRVLFVCEKRAALDVVAHRLRQVGLGPLVATIHDSELDRKAFISEMGDTYESWVDDAPNPDSGFSAEERARAEALSTVEELLWPLESIFSDLHQPRHAALSVADLIERLVVLRANGAAHPGAGFGNDTTVEIGHVDVGEWLAARPGLDATRAALVAASLPPEFGRHGVFRVKPSVMRQGEPLRAIPALGAELVAAIDAFAQAMPTALDEVPVEGLSAVGNAGPFLAAVLSTHQGAVFDRSTPAHGQLRLQHDQLMQLHAQAQAAAQIRDRWVNPLSAEDARAGLELAQAKEGSFLKFLNGRWRSLKSLVHSSYRFDAHQVEPTLVSVLTELLDWYMARDAVARQQQLLQSGYGTADTVGLLTSIDQLASHPVVATVASASASGIAIDVPAAQQAIATIDRHRAALLVSDQATLADIRRIAADLGAMSISHERAVLAWADMESADNSVLLAAVELGRDMSLDRIETDVLSATLERLEREGRLGDMTSAQLDDSVTRVLDAYETLLDTNAGAVLSRARQRFSQHAAFSEASMAGRSDEDKGFKKAYSAGRRVLENEFKKKMRHKSIRDLAGGPSGLVVRDLKPIWLMSPLSVSSTLPLDDELFDVVIFDEASQIPVEDAVPTLYRARQVIVVGDRMQLPPTRFFSTESDEDDEVLVDDDGFGLTISLDADSFLTQADLALDSMMLSWHYRSRSESLIGYSNHAFYGGRLATVPDRSFGVGGSGSGLLEPLVAMSAEHARANLTSTLERPISFHHIENGLYQDRRNEPEAEYVAELVRALLADDNGLTVGVAAFSEAQQTTIEAALNELALNDPVFATAYEAELNRTEDGEFVGLFVKNLENVQGDERDVIIMSVCYGPAADGKMRMNFGPINQAGGERRLNVIFSRSKQHMAIVSTIEGHQITNTHNDGAANLARFLEYAAAESVGDSARADGILARLLPPPPPPSPVGDGGTASATGGSVGTPAVASELAARLGERGWQVDTDVGRSVFTIDVAVRGDNGYRLGVMIDPGSQTENATARLVADAGVLKAFGWPVTRVFVTEWLKQPEQVVERLDQRLRSETDDEPRR